MAKVMDLINAFDCNTKDYDVFLQRLLSVNDDLPTDIDDMNNFQSMLVSHVNSRLNESRTRYDGLNILMDMLPRCSKEILSKHAILWMTKASQTLENPQSSLKEITLACKVLARLIVTSKDIPELQKYISIQCVKQLVVAVSNVECEKKSGATLYLIATILYHYRESSERLQTTIRKMILPLVDAKEKSLVQAGANCYSLLARATERSFKPPSVAKATTYTGWVYSQALLCNSLDAIMDNLFAGLIELECNDNGDKLELVDISEENVMGYYCALETRFANLCTYLSTMLRGSFGKNSVSPNDILRVLCRGLAVTPLSLRNEDSFKKQMLYFILPKLHMSLLAVLDAFIKGFKKELVPFAIMILQLYQQTLKWTENMAENETTISHCRPFKNIRIAVYKSLTTWLSCLGGLSGIELVAQHFLPHILKDITPEKQRVFLTVQKTQHLSKRALKRYKDNQYENSASLGSVDATVKNSCENGQLCTEALITLENIFFNASCALKQTFYKATQNVIVPLLYDYYLGKEEENFYRANNSCRLCLLRALKAIQVNPHPLTPPPSQYSIEIFGMALRDSDLDVIREAKLAMAQLEKIAHPSAPTLQLSVERTVEGTNGEKELGIHWSRPIEINRETTTTSENGIAQMENNLWEKFKESRDESWTITNEDLPAKMRLEETHQDETSCTIVNDETVQSAADGPTPSKQQKLGYNKPGELMDTSEDEFLSMPQNNEISLSEKFQSSAYEKSPRNKTKIICQSVSDQVPGMDESELVLEKSQRDDDDDHDDDDDDEPASYLTLKKIQANEARFPDGIMAAEHNYSNNDSETLNGDPNAEESTRKIDDRCIDDNSDDEAILSLFCDELK